YYMRKKLSEAHRKRAAIEPIIGHLKSDHRLGRNFYKGVVGDNINIMLAAAAFNFKRMMNKWKSSFLSFFQMLYYSIMKLIFNQNRAELTFAGSSIIEAPMNKSLRIVGVVNIAADSFPDGGRYLAPDAAIAQA